MLIERLFSLAGKVALVTGASSGIGSGIAAAFANAGAKVILVARREAELQSAAERIRQSGGSAAHIACDLAERAALYACADNAADFFGPPDIVVNAAGVNIRRPMSEVTEEDWDRTMRINLDACFFLPQRLAPAMLKKGWGKIINIASMQSVRAFSNSGPYGASKGGIMQLTRAQAEAWSGQGICANAIVPGFVATPLTAPVVNDPVRWKANAARTFIGRNGEVDDMHGAAIFLASHASDYVTGHSLFVDGGFSCS